MARTFTTRVQALVVALTWTSSFLALPAYAQSATELLAEADRLAWLKNWTKAEPLFSKAEQMFASSGDERDALYSKISAIRGRLPKLPLIEVSQNLADDLEKPIVQSDSRLKLRCLVVGSAQESDGLAD